MTQVTTISPSFALISEIFHGFLQVIRYPIVITQRNRERRCSYVPYFDMAIELSSAEEGSGRRLEKTA
jgi:hypothetical protein